MRPRRIHERRIGFQQATDKFHHFVGAAQSRTGFRSGGRGLPPLPMQVLNDDKTPKVAEALQAMWQRELGVRITIELPRSATGSTRSTALLH